jgi:ligand-binding sensor domain-containing protein
MKKLIILGLILMLGNLTFLVAQTIGTWENYVNPETITDHVETNNEIWFSTLAGVVQLDKATLQTTIHNKATSNLPSNFVEGIAKDSNGDIWIGTYNQAIAKFDGTTWTTYDFSQVFTNAVGTVETYCIEVDNQDIVWVGTEEGLLRFDGTNWQLYDDQDAGGMLINVWTLDVNSQGDLFIGSFDVFKFDGTTFNNLSDTAGLLLYGGAEAFMDANDNLWVSNGFNTLGKFDGTNWTVYIGNNGQIPVNYLYTIGESPIGEIFLTSASGKYTLQNGTWIQDNISSLIPLNGDNLTTYFFDNQGNEWLANDSELIKNDGSTVTDLNLGLDDNEILNVTIFNNLKYFLTPKTINTFDGTTWGLFDFPDSLFGASYELRQMEIIDVNNIWIASRTDGIMNWNGSTWTVYNQNNTILPSYINEFVYDENSQILWCATNIGVVKFDGTTWAVFNSSNTMMGHNHVRGIALDNNNMLYATVTISGIAEVWRLNGATWENIAIGSTAPQDQIRALHFDKENVLWAGAFDGDVYKYNDSNWEMWNVISSTVSNVYVETMTSDNLGNIYIGTYAGSAMFDGTSWTTWTVDNSGISQNHTKDLAIDDNGKLWFATDHGVSALQVNLTSTSSILSKNSSLKVFPNPIRTMATVTFDLNEATDNIRVKIISIDGRTIQEHLIQGRANHGTQQLEINRNQMVNGLYYLSIQTDSEQLVKPILIQD